MTMTSSERNNSLIQLQSIAATKSLYLSQGNPEDQALYLLIQELGYQTQELMPQQS